MKRLMLLRHAKAEPASIGDLSDEADHARPLARRGWEDAEALDASDAFRGHVPDLVLVSSAVRTRETLAALSQLAAVETSVRDALYLAEAATLRRALADLPETVGHVLLVGHNPGLHMLCRQLAADPFGDATPKHLQRAARLDTGLPTCTMAVFAMQGPWGGLAEPDAHAALVDLRTPDRTRRGPATGLRHDA
ncbi:phosphohistidine phosphatase [Endobacter medicaginis]|jgi:phosphohistidine phosphatase|uniref:Histidine phosphatase family protein n=1 Tax=Endobacter medicaginis TaxID=1181271 RepID=A0A839UZ18_9PROT|nr:histidine phosphatase family protein [Endobacter medicaginis]MBB3175036.1 phosphohistidine phosphatase [Endobacter medicaginis]MCX5476345.1 histidine phosphatase family protein [Endobacter medicaginis]NVN30103.1 histidine phosphatase family protein [Endobacter medicaginis]